MPTRTWRDVAGAWLGIGTAPTALLLGAGLAERYAGPIPLFSILAGTLLIFIMIWFQGYLGLQPPLGDGGNLTEVAPRYFSTAMQRVVGALIALGMTGWFGLNVAMGGAALGALIGLPQWLAALAMGVPILVLSLRGLKSWNTLATLTTICVLVLIALVVTHYGASAIPFAVHAAAPMPTLGDIAAIMGFVSVFSVRAPDFTAGLGSRRDLAMVGVLLCAPLMITILAGASLEQGTGSADLVSVLAGSNGLWIGNLLITLAMIAPTFTTLYSGAPAIRAAVGWSETVGMSAMAVIGFILAFARIDQWLLPWLSLLAAMLPPVLVLLAIESVRRRSGRGARMLPTLLWLTGAAVSLALTLAHYSFASLVGMAATGLAAGAWYWKGNASQR
jgi:cytosine permease